MAGVTISNTKVPDSQPVQQASNNRKEASVSMKMEGSFNRKLTSFTEIPGGKDRKDPASAGSQISHTALFEAKGTSSLRINGKEEVQNQQEATTELKTMLSGTAITTVKEIEAILVSKAAGKGAAKSIGVQHPARTAVNIQVAGSQDSVMMQKEVEGLSASSEKERQGLREKATPDHELLLPLLKHITTIISENEAGIIPSKDAAQLLNMLKKWSEVQKNPESKLQLSQLSNLEENKSNGHAKPILSSLIESYQKRTAIESSAPYKNHSVVSPRDVANWVKEAVEGYVEQSDSSESKHPGFPQQEMKHDGQPVRQTSNKEKEVPASIRMEENFSSKLTSTSEITAIPDSKDHTSADYQSSLTAVVEAKAFAAQKVSGKDNQEGKKEMSTTNLEHQLSESARIAIDETEAVLISRVTGKDEAKSIEVQDPVRTTGSTQVADSQHTGFMQKQSANSEVLSKKEPSKESVSNHELVVPLLKHITTIISESEAGTVSVKDAAQLLNMLKKWSNLQKHSENKFQLRQLNNVEEDKSNSQAKLMLTSLSETYRKRAAMEGSGQYRTHSSVSARDVANWVKQAIERYAEESGFSEGEKFPALPKEELKYSGQMIQPMTKAEQFMIHSQQSGRMTVDEQKLMQEFEQAAKAIRINQVNGNTELLLKVKPANLGEVAIKMVEINGEMVVKIHVGSQAAKEMLESNIHQLRHMFSPSQVVIEKTENSSAFQDSYQPGSQQESLKDEDTEREPTVYEWQGEIEEENETGKINFSEMLIQKEEGENNDDH